MACRFHAQVETVFDNIIGVHTTVSLSSQNAQTCLLDVEVHHLMSQPSTASRNKINPKQCQLPRAHIYVIVITQEMVQHGLCCPRVGCCHEGAARVTTSARGQLTHVASFLG